MKTLAFAALGALALTGCDFGGSADSQPLALASIEATGLPTDIADPDGAPDVFVEIQNGAGRAIWRSETMADMDVSAGVSFSVPADVQAASATQPLHIAIYDYDTSLTDSEMMVRTQTFTPEQLAAQSEMQLAAYRGTGSVTLRATAAQ